MKKVLVTGGATGIGKATALLFKQNGWDVFITYNKTAPDYDGVTAIKCDLTNPDDIQSVFDRFDSLDVLVNNAGVSLVKMINDTTLDDYDYVTSVNERAVYFCSKHAVSKMMKNHSGAIINISSMWGQCGASCETLYSMTNAGVIGFSKALADELAPSGITVNCVAPGIIDTRMNSQFDLDELKAQVPMNKIGTPQQVAHAVWFFANNTYTTGQTLGVNGGII